MILLSYLLKVNLVFAGLFLVYYFLLRREKFLLANRVVLWMIVIAGFTLPLSPAVYFKSFAGSGSPVAGKQLGLPSASFRDSHVTAGKNVPLDSGKLINSVMADPAGWIAKAYVIVALFLGMRFVLRMVRVCTILSKSKRSKRGGIVYCVPAHAVPPFSFFHFIVVSPNMSDETYRQVLAHERSHCVQRHSFDLLLSDLTAIVLWINPLVYLYRREVNLNLEFLADQATIARGIDLRSYQLTLVSCSGNAPFNFPAMPFSSRLRERIRMMNTCQPDAKQGYKYVMLLPLLLLLSVLTGFRKDQVSVHAKDVAGTRISPVKKAGHHMPLPLSVKQEKRLAGKTPIAQKEAAPATDDHSENSIEAIYIDAKTDTVKFRLTSESVPARFNGIYVINDQILSDEDVRKALQPTRELTFILPSRPVLSVYSADDAGAIGKWGERAQHGVISLQTPISGRSD